MIWARVEIWVGEYWGLQLPVSLFSGGLFEQLLWNIESQEMIKQRLWRMSGAKIRQKEKKDMLEEFGHLNYMNSLLA